MSVRRLAGIAMAALLASGCMKEESATTDTAAAAGAADSTHVESTTAGSRDPVIGRDSAFGPIGTMDSDGTVRPIRK